MRGTFLVILLINLIVQFMPRKDSPILRSLKYVFSVVIFLLILGYFLDNRATWVVIIILIIFFAFMEFLFPLTSQRKANGYLEKLRMQEITEMEVANNDLLSFINIKYQSLFLILGFLVFTSIMFSYGIGLNKAKNQKEFFVVDNENQVILEIYNDTIISTNFDRKSKSITGPLIINKLDNIGKLFLKKEDIGPLKSSYSTI